MKERLEAERAEAEAQRIARRVLEGSDPEMSWKEADYAYPEAAASALVGTDGDPDVRRRAIEIVAEQIAERV